MGSYSSSTFFVSCPNKRTKEKGGGAATRKGINKKGLKDKEGKTGKRKRGRTATRKGISKKGMKAKGGKTGKSKGAGVTYNPHPPVATKYQQKSCVKPPSPSSEVLKKLHAHGRREAQMIGGWHRTKANERSRRLKAKRKIMKSISAQQKLENRYMCLLKVIVACMSCPSVLFALSYSINFLSCFVCSLMFTLTLIFTYAIVVNHLLRTVLSDDNSNTCLSNVCGVTNITGSACKAMTPIWCKPNVTPEWCECPSSSDFSDFQKRKIEKSLKKPSQHS